MKTLKEILEKHHFSQLESTRDDILDNEYILRSGIINKEEKAIKNLKRVFYGDSNIDMLIINDVVHEFLEQR